MQVATVWLVRIVSAEGMYIPMTGASLLVGFFISLGGMAAFAYGKKTSRFVPLIGGLVLMIYPYFVSSVLVMSLVAVGLVLGMVFVRED